MSDRNHRKTAEAADVLLLTEPRLAYDGAATDPVLVDCHYSIAG